MGGHHKQWLLDQIVRKIRQTNKAYEKWVKKYEYYDEKNQEYSEEKIYEWDKGVAP